jgi:AraC-like DNA-binding protein
MAAKAGASRKRDLYGYIYYWYDRSLLLLDPFEAAEHRHYPMEIQVGLECPFKMDFGSGWREYRAVIIDSNRPHRFDGTGGRQALLMIDPRGKAAARLKRNALRGEKSRELGMESVGAFVAPLLGCRERARAIDEVGILCDDLVRSISGDAASGEAPGRRMAEILGILKGLPEKKMPAAVLAERVGLSESRLAHVIKEETGVPLRQLLLWLRLMEAVKLIFAGMSFTDAAYEAGFADSAHLSRTYKRMCGLNLSDLLNRSPSVRIVT